MTQFGFIGLGDMGVPMATNLVAGGAPLVVFDAAGTAARAPDGAQVANSIGAVAAASDVVFVCVPDGAASLAVAGEIVGGEVAAAEVRRVGTVINMSTVGIEAAKQVAAVLGDAGITYVDAPVSGGRAGAVNGSITLMWAGPAALLAQLGDVLGTFTGNVFHVGDVPGQGQALKLLNNYLSAVAMSATSEAVAFGLSQGLEMDVMLGALNVSTGQNTATRDKFPAQVATGAFDAGFRLALMEKDVGLYMEAVRAAGTSARIGEEVRALYGDALAQIPDGDFTEIFKVVRGD